jgi:curved DNA binding protein
MIEEEVKKTFASKKSKNLERGIAFPTCISVNHIMGHFSPLVDESQILLDGDMAKIICGSHFDGYAANAATTVVVGDGAVAGRKADVVLAAWYAFQAAQRQIAEASTNHEVTEVIQKMAEQFQCNAVEGVLSHKVKRHIIDGNDVIINRVSPGNNVAEFQFAAGDVIGLDILVSSGEGKPREDESRCTVFKRELEQVYNLKMKSARAFFVEVNKRFPTLPFSLRSMTDQTAAKVGVRECINHDMLVPYPVLTEHRGEFVAHF